jgi:hypothetical protein
MQWPQARQMIFRLTEGFVLPVTIRYCWNNGEERACSHASWGPWADRHLRMPHSSDSPTTSDTFDQLTMNWNWMRVHRTDGDCFTHSYTFLFEICRIVQRSSRITIPYCTPMWYNTPRAEGIISTPRKRTRLLFKSKSALLGQGSWLQRTSAGICSESDHPIDPVNGENRTRSGGTTPPIYGIQR